MCQAPEASFQKRPEEQGGLWAKDRAEWASTQPDGPAVSPRMPKAPSLLPKSSSLWESRGVTTQDCTEPPFFPQEEMPASWMGFSLWLPHHLKGRCLS